VTHWVPLVPVPPTQPPHVRHSPLSHCELLTHQHGVLVEQVAVLPPDSHAPAAPISPTGQT
jgi:hypothetical protein